MGEGACSSDTVASDEGQGGDGGGFEDECADGAGESM